MESFFTIINITIPLLYLVVLVLYGKFFYSPGGPVEKRMTSALSLVLSIHLAEIVGRGIYLGHFPISNFSSATSLVVVAVVSLYFFVEWQVKIKSTGVFILLFATCLQFLSACFYALGSNPKPLFQMPLFVFHTSAAVLGYAALLVSAVFSLVYLLLFRELKKNRFGILYSRLPSLEEMRRMNLLTTLAGFCFLSVAIILGLLLGYIIHDKPRTPGLKGYFAIAIWIIYGVQLAGDRLFQWSGKKLAYISLGGLTVLLLSLIGLALYLSNFHQVHPMWVGPWK